MRDLLDQLVTEMVDKGIRWEEAEREFQRRFIARVVQRCDGHVGRAAVALGMHRNTLARKLGALRIKAR